MFNTTTQPLPPTPSLTTTCFPAGPYLFGQVALYLQVNLVIVERAAVLCLHLQRAHLRSVLPHDRVVALKHKRLCLSK